MANIHDVAKRAAVSISTVSLVINGSPLVKEETREHVQRVIEDMGYVPNNDARSLRQGRTNNLGSLTGGMTSTPALGTLVAVSGTDDVAAAYAATYPVALVLIVLASNLIGPFIPEVSK